MCPFEATILNRPRMCWHNASRIKASTRDHAEASAHPEGAGNIPHKDFRLSSRVCETFGIMPRSSAHRPQIRRHRQRRYPSAARRTDPYASRAMHEKDSRMRGSSAGDLNNLSLHRRHASCVALTAQGLATRCRHSQRRIGLAPQEAGACATIPRSCLCRYRAQNSR